MADALALCTSPHQAMSYRRLSNTRNEIRLLVIEPPVTEDTRIRCRLENASLFDLALEFAALSYHWGDHAVVKRIMLDGDLVPITFNLYKALEEMRRRGIYRVWADDLCINQHDDEERSQQVLRMGAIYRSASMVFAHIRAPNLACQQALASAIQRIVEPTEVPKQAETQALIQAKKEVRKRKQPLRSRSVSDGIQTSNSNRTEVSLSLADVHHGMWLSAAEETALFLFLDSPYWRRAWIIQEISMNPRLMIVWGRQAFDMGQVIEALSRLSNYISGNREKVWYHIKRLYKIRTSQLALKPLSLVEALGLCYLAKAQIDRDYVFGLLGLAHDGAHIVPVPSYTVSQDQINKDMTIRLIRATGNLDIIVSKGHGVDTWYPNWFDPKYWHAYRLAHLGVGRLSLLASTNYGPYRASGHHIPSFRVDGMSMVAKGFLLGSIVDCSPTLDEAKSSGLPRAEILQSRAWKRNSKTERMYFMPEPVEIMRTLCWLLVDVTRPKARGHRRVGTHLYTLLYRLLNRKEDIIEQAPSLVQWLNCCEAQCFKVHEKRLASYFSMKTNSPLSAVDREELEEDCSLIQKNLRANMRLGYTSEGHMGWFHDNTRVGDQVAILLGSSMPCVLRERPAGGYTVVGQCIVDGVMKGEALREGLSNLQDLRLH
ncbi:heterokaryon incompatibility protein-domain-containing protein [Xylaria sp. CBS 124048]|nr:heterokaryon incompatibility protein-domain-containing protein [Xylaria sp. CBS 124048]